MLSPHVSPGTTDSRMGQTAEAHLSGRHLGTRVCVHTVGRIKDFCSSSK